MLEREIKLRFDDAPDARAAVLAAGATPVHGRRFQDDALFDTEGDESWSAAAARCGCAARARGASSRSRGPSQPGPMKLREELETVVADGAVLHQVLERLGLHVWFRYQKYREEFAREDVVIAIDETPIGTFVEIEGTEPASRRRRRAGPRRRRTTSSTRTTALFLKYREALGFRGTDMMFDEPDRIA